ncbi:hypothetical protein NIES4073_69070 [Kalymmatonema gypsitolerans NIES-4073]|nr:hypothetical protein NIES4073_69070 [Scytonema sp. NIES-4073]
MRLYFLLYESQFIEIIESSFYGIISKPSVDKFVVNSEEKNMATEKSVPPPKDKPKKTEAGFMNSDFKNKSTDSIKKIA